MIQWKAKNEESSNMGFAGKLTIRLKQAGVINELSGMYAFEF